MDHTSSIVVRLFVLSYDYHTTALYVSQAQIPHGERCAILAAITFARGEPQYQRRGEDTMAMIIKFCSCDNKYQDKALGKNKRWFNQGPTHQTCTSCGRKMDSEAKP